MAVSLEQHQPWPDPHRAERAPAPATRPRHRRTRREQLAHDLEQLARPFEPARDWVRDRAWNWGGTAVDTVQLVFRTAGALIAQLAGLTVTIAMVILIMGAGR